MTMGIVWGLVGFLICAIIITVICILIIVVVCWTIKAGFDFEVEFEDWEEDNESKS